MSLSRRGSIQKLTTYCKYFNDPSQSQSIINFQIIQNYCLYKQSMSESLTSSKVRILTKDRSPSISEIQHEQSKVSFSILSLLQLQDHQRNKIQNQNLKLNKNQEQFRREYVQINFKPQTYKQLIHQKNQRLKTNKLFNKKPNQFNEEYFESALILTPKLINKNGINSSIKSSKKTTSNASIQSKQNRLSKQRSIKDIKQVKIGFSQKKIQTKKLKKQGHNLKQNFIFIQSPYHTSSSKSLHSNRLQSRNKSCRQIVVIQHGQNIQKTRKKKKIKIEKLSKKQNIVPNLQSLDTKRKNICRNNEDQENKGIISQKQKVKLLNHYWGCEFKVKKSNKNRYEDIKSIQNLPKLMKFNRKS